MQRTFSTTCLALALLATLPAIAQTTTQSTLLLQQGRTDEAMRALEARVGANPFDAVAMNNLAAVKAGRQDWSGAAELLVRAHQLAPDNALITGNLNQLNAFLSQRVVPSAAAAPIGATAAIWPEPPPLWQQQPLAATSASGGKSKKPPL